MRLVIIALLVFASIFVIRAQSSVGLDDKEYAAILTVVGTKSFVIKDSTRADEWNTANWKYLSETFKGIGRETVSSYLESNKISARIERKFQTNSSYTIVSSTEIDQFFRRKKNLVDAWDKFKKNYAIGGYFETSRVGFNQDGSQALIFIGYYCGGLCADGSWYFLSFIDGKWKLVATKPVWAS